MRLLDFGNDSPNSRMTGKMRNAAPARNNQEKHGCMYAQAKRANRAHFRLRDSTKSMRRAVARQSPVAAAD
jgi:hypothetical protein